MDIEKAKELLNLCPICDANKEGCNCERRNAYVWVFEWLEKFTFSATPDIGKYGEPVCPECLEAIPRSSYKYCPECGQKIDWSGYYDN